MTIEKKKEHGNAGNKNAQQGRDAKTATVHFKTTPKNKANWLEAANGEKLVKWIEKALNDKINNSDER